MLMGCSDDQRERWIKRGLLPKAQRQGNHGKRGNAQGIYPAEMIPRIAIIQTKLEEGGDLTEAALELFLQNYDLYNGEVIRALLLRNIDRWSHLIHYRQRSISARPDQEQKRIADLLREHPEAFSKHEKALVPLSYRTLTNSRRKRNFDKPYEDLENGLPNLSLPHQRECVECAQPQMLIQAADQAKRIVIQFRKGLAHWFYIGLSADPEEASQRLIPGHQCKTHHTLPQVMRLYFTLLGLMPDGNTSELKHVLLFIEQLLRDADCADEAKIIDNLWDELDAGATSAEGAEQFLRIMGVTALE